MISDIICKSKPSLLTFDVRLFFPFLNLLFSLYFLSVPDNIPNLILFFSSDFVYYERFK